MEWEPDPSLRRRMILTLAVIAVMPMAFTVTMTLAFNYIIAPTAEVTMETQVAPIALGSELFVTVFALTLVGMGLAYARGGKDVLRSTGARRLSEDAPGAPDRDLHSRLRRLAQTAGMPTPDLALVPTDAPNAYATGRSREDATVVVTRGLVEQLDDDELDAVLAHELAHIRNRDAAVMSIVYLVPTFTFVLSTMTYRLLRGFFRVMANSRPSRSRDGRALVALIVLFVVTAVVTITISAVFWLASSALFMLLSQYREHAADRGAAAITGDPLALASALETIDDEMRRLPDRDLRDLDGGAEALYISSLSLPMFNDDDSFASTLLSQDMFPDSHPPTEERVERLRELAAELES